MKKPKVWSYFRGANVWGGIALALVGEIGEAFGSEHGFEHLMFFGALSLGLGLGSNVEKSKVTS